MSRSRSFQVRGFLHVADEYATALNETGSPNTKHRPFLERMKNRVHLGMERQAHPIYYDRYLDHTVLSRPLYNASSSAPGRITPRVGELAFVLLRAAQAHARAKPVKEVRGIGVMGEELAAFLNTLRARDEPRFRAVEHALHMLIPSISGIHVDVNSLGEVELRLGEDKTLIPARVVSEGTLRMLGLLAIAGAKEPPALVGFEEPENGIHPRRLQLIAELLRTREAAEDTQMIVTTHSPLLVDLIPDEFLYVCRRSDGQTTIDPFKSLPFFRDKNISQA